MFRAILIATICLFLGSKASAVQDWYDGQGYAKCKNTIFMNPPKIRRFHSSISELKVYINWNSFYSRGYTSYSQRMQFEASVAYMVRQWAINFPKKPTLVFAGETPYSEPASGEVIIEMQTSPSDWGYAMPAFGTSYDTCDNSGKRCSECAFYEQCDPQVLVRYGMCFGPGGDEPGTAKAGKIVVYKYLNPDNTEQLFWVRLPQDDGHAALAS